MPNSYTVLVSGASGSLSRRVIQYLLAIGNLEVIAGTRFPQFFRPFPGSNLEVRALDYGDPSCMARAFHGVERLFLVCPLTFESLSSHQNQLRLAVEMASRAGITRVIYTSGSHPDPDSPMLLAPSHRSAEWALMRSGMEWVSLRLNFPTDYLWELVVCQAWTGHLVAAAGDGAAAFVTEEDAAHTAAVLLASRDRSGEMLEVTGPCTETFAGIAEAVREFTCQKMSYLRASASAARRHLISSAGLSDQAADLTLSCQLAIAAGKYGPATSVVKDLTGKTPSSVREYILARRETWADDRQALGFQPEGVHKP